MNDFIVVLVTSSSREEGENIVTSLVEEKLIACGNVIQDLISIFYWERKVCKEEEVLLVLKTKYNLFEKLSERVKELHSYDVPEIIALPVIKGNMEYLDWIEGTITQS